MISVVENRVAYFTTCLATMYAISRKILRSSIFVMQRVVLMAVRILLFMHVNASLFHFGSYIFGQCVIIWARGLRSFRSP